MGKITKPEIIRDIGKHEKIKQETVKTVVDRFIGLIRNALRSGNSVELHGFGAFENRKNNGGWKRNPKTGQKVYKAPSKRPHFRAFNSFKDGVNDK